MKQANKEKSMRFTLFFTLLILAIGLSGCGTQFGLSKKMAPDEYVEYDPTKAEAPPAVPLPAGFRSDGSRGITVEGNVTIGSANPLSVDTDGDGDEDIGSNEGGDFEIVNGGKGVILTNTAGTVTKRVRLNDAGDGLIFEDE